MKKTLAIFSMLLLLVTYLFVPVTSLAQTQSITPLTNSEVVKNNSSPTFSLPEESSSIISDEKIGKTIQDFPIVSSLTD